jgi:hypothetical protein
MIRMLVICRLGLEGDVPDHSTFSKNRHGRLRDSELLRRLFDMTVARRIAEGLVGGESFAVDASRQTVGRAAKVPRVGGRSRRPRVPGGKDEFLLAATA